MSKYPLLTSTTKHILIVLFSIFVLALLVNIYGYFNRDKIKARNLEIMIEGLGPTHDYMYDSEDEISLQWEIVEVGRNKEARVFWALRNNLEWNNGNKSTRLHITLGEKPEEITAIYCNTDKIFLMTYPEVIIDKNEVKRLPLIITTTDTPKGTYECKVDICLPEEYNGTGISTPRCGNRGYAIKDFQVIVK